MMNVGKKSLAGFTLIEVLTVVSIIGLIFVVATVSFSGIRTKQRDTQRITDVKKIILGIEKYKAFHGDYPSCGEMFVCSNKLIWHDCLGQKLEPFIGEIPVDPSNLLAVYCYSESGRNDGDAAISLSYDLQNVYPNESGMSTNLYTISFWYSKGYYTSIIKIRDYRNF